MKIRLAIAIFAAMLLTSVASAQAAGKGWNCTFTVTTTALVTRCPSGGNRPNSRKEVNVMVPAAGATVFCGGSNITVATGGNGIAATETGNFGFGDTGLFCVVAAGTQDVDLLEAF